MKKEAKMKRILLPILAIGVLLSSACGTSTTPPETITLPPETITITLTQRIGNITPQEASALIQENDRSTDFLIIDVRTVEEFAGGYIENAVIMDYYYGTFRDDLDNLPKGKIYLIYSQSGNRSGESLAIMEELGFLEVYHLSGGIIAWIDAGLPVQTLTRCQVADMFSLIDANQNNPDFVIIDVRTPEEFAGGHIENALILDYYSETFQDEIEVLDRNKMYLIYGDADNRSGAALAIMEELGFLGVHNLSGGLIAWQAAGLPVVTG